MIITALIVLAIVLVLGGYLYPSGTPELRTYPYRSYALPSFGTILFIVVLLYLVGVR